MTDKAEITLELTIADPDLCADLEERIEGDERNEFAVTAMKIGALALRQAQGRIDAERVRAEGDRLIENMGRALDEHQRSVTSQIGNSLKEYFDPESGRFNERVQRLIGNNGHDGELAQLIRGQIGGDGSELARTLTAHVGEDSLLMKKLNPEASDGLIGLLAKATETTLSEQRDCILQEFSLDNGDSALTRLVSELKKSNGDLVNEFSLDKEDSALKRLMNQVEGAQRQITSQFSLDEDDSALARMRKQLLEVLEAQNKENRHFQAEVRASLAAMTARRQEADRSTRHGNAFEDVVFDYVNERSQKSGDVATRTGNTTGVIRNNKKGDAVVRLGPDHIAAGAQIVIEAKENASYKLPDALNELQEARKNREAGVGLFVFSKSIAPEGLEPFGRYGNDIVVIWDKDDGATDVFMDAGLSVATALSVRAKSHRDEVGADFEEIERIIAAIEKQVGGLDEITKLTTTIQNNSDKVLNRARIMSRELNTEIGNLNVKMGELREVLGEGVEMVIAGAAA